jgi:hypothetical protein
MERLDEILGNGSQGKSDRDEHVGEGLEGIR